MYTADKWAKHYNYHNCFILTLKVQVFYICYFWKVISQKNIYSLLWIYTSQCNSLLVTLIQYIFYRCTGIRDDLNFLLEEDLSSINLCSLHCEMRNCEQLLGSLGLFAYRIGSLDLLNEALADYGPENCRGFPRVTVKERKGQQTEIDRRNINVASFSDMFLNNNNATYRKIM